MPQHRQQSGSDRLPIRIRNEPADRIHHRLTVRTRRHGKTQRRPSVATVGLMLVVIVVVAIAAFRSIKGFRGDSGDGVDDLRSDLEFRPRSNWSSEYSKEVGFGHGSKIGKDSRYWDRDDRRRDREFSEEELSEEKVEDRKDQILEGGSNRNGQIGGDVIGDGIDSKDGANSGARLYNEGGRAELDSYKVEFETLLNNSTEDEYDDGIDVQDELDDIDQNSEVRKQDEINGGKIEKDEALNKQEKGSSFRGSGSFNNEEHSNEADENVKGLDKKSSSKKKPKRHKFSSCQIKFLNSTAQIIEPPENKKFTGFSLKYTESEEMPKDSENWEPKFAGHQTLQEREESFYARDQKINCGFVRGPSDFPTTGFDIADDDKKFMSSCHIAVSSCIFGNSDHLRIPFGKTITQLSKKNVCFVMFIDEETKQTLLSEGQRIDTKGFAGLWKIVVVKNLPYKDMRRVGKVPKLLAHRLFPSSRYSIWLDSKLRLQSDPYLILEYFLWRHNYEYAISNHYDRHCVWEEVAQNKKLNKYNHTVIDQQFEFYQSDGLKKFDPSDPNKLLPSYVPEGSFIVRAHTPMSNLFSCLWYNEVERFTPRDQLSFAYTFLKLRRMNPDNPFCLNMFKDCERRAMAKLFHHRAEEKPTSTSKAAR